MNRIAPESPRQRERRIRAEAAVWFARRQGVRRNAAIEAGLRLWLSEDPDHAAQFKIAADVWNDPAQCLRKSPRRAVERPVLTSFAAILVLTAVAGVIVYWLLTTLSTGIGERLSKTLGDGTQVELNTDTHIAVHYQARQREVVLESGEVYFNVVKHEPRPFVVVAGDREVVATDTSFVVRRDDSSATTLSVTLLEGCVIIRPTGTRDSRQTPGTYQATILNAGERVRYRRDGPPIVERPALDEVMSWMQGELTFVNTPLAEAVQEFNRYSLNRITVRSPGAESIRVNGVFRTEDSLSFIRTVAQDQHLRLQVQGEEWILESVPAGG